MNILITGASGQLSSYLFEEAELRNHEAWGVDLVAPRHQSAEGRVQITDVRDTSEMIAQLQGAEAVIHTAAQVSVQKSLEDPLYDVDINVMGTVSVLKAAIAAKVKKFIFISSAAVYGNPLSTPVSELHPVNPLSVYGTSKLAAENYVRMFENTYGLQTVIIRPFNFYSPRAEVDSPYSGVISKFIDCAAHNKPIIINGDGQQTRDFLHAQDVSKMIYAALESEVSGVTFNCGSGQAVSIEDLAKKVAKLASNKIEIQHGEPRNADIRYSVADVQLARDLLDFHTSITLEEGLQELFDASNQLSAKISMSMQ